MNKEILLNILEQNRLTNSFALEKINDENITYRISPESSSVGFIFRHIAETLNLFGTFFGITTDVENTTMGIKDAEQKQNVEECRQLTEKGYYALKNLIENSDDLFWLEIMETPFFGSVPRVRLLSHVFYHTSHHAGQISMILANGKNF